MIRLMESDVTAQRYLCIGSNQPFKELMTVIATEMNVKAPTREVKKIIVSIARRVLSLFHGLFGSRSNITKETVENLFSSKSYDNSKIIEELNFEFRLLDEQVRNAVAGRID
jgi:hypothetical protein